MNTKTIARHIALIASLGANAIPHQICGERGIAMRGKRTSPGGWADHRGYPKEESSSTWYNARATPSHPSDSTNSGAI